jgi:hypothetical protein
MTSSLISQFAKHDILITETAPHQYSFSFDGPESDFADALEAAMDEFGYEKQEENWFPGSAGNDGHEMYYIEKITHDEEFYLAFDWHKKEFHPE